MATNNWNMPEIQGSASDAKVTYCEVRDTIPIRGTQYRIRVPEGWNGTLISDLDYDTSADSPKYLALLERGYALAGTARRPERLFHYDPAHEIHDLISVLDIFASLFGEPERTIEHGCSGGGTVTLAIAETHPDRFDGGVAACASTSPWMANTHLDGMFALKALIAPDLPIVSLPLEDPAISEIGDRWQASLERAQATPEGRARIALAMTVGQWPAWGGPGEAPCLEPKSCDTTAIQESMYLSLKRLLPSKVTFGTGMLEQSAPGQLRWNTGVDYAAFYAHGDVINKRVVDALYAQAGLELDADLDAINAADRVQADPSAVRWWSAPGRTHIGEPKVPLLRMHTTGDGLVYPSMAQGYGELAEHKGYGDLFRLVFANRWGHCTFSLGEWLASIETMMQRLDTGAWPDLSPDALNALAMSLDPADDARFVEHRPVNEYNRTWCPNLADYSGTR